jgi:hypothetical protein
VTPIRASAHVTAGGNDTMQQGSWIAMSQSLLPIVAGVFMIAMTKWLSNHWTAGMMARTARVTSKLRHGRGRGI